MAPRIRRLLTMGAALPLLLAGPTASGFAATQRGEHSPAGGTDRPAQTIDAGPSVHQHVTGAAELWRRGTTGEGVRVALVDTGIAAVPDLEDRIVPVTDPLTGEPSPCVDLSGERSCHDGYGHGTFLAGLLAGDGSSSGGAWPGIAPGAELVSVKAAGRDGATDPSRVLAAVQWVVSNAEAYEIDVLVLAVGVTTDDPEELDPLAYAVERAWDAGVTVVTAAGNGGPEAGTVVTPADDPLVVTVGASDDAATVATDDDRLSESSSRGPTPAGVAKPDVVAPGHRLVSLRSPGSTLDREHPVVVDDAHRRGTGTSMAAAVVGGAAALLLDDDPTRTPDDVKHALRTSARPLPAGPHPAAGAGVVDVARAAEVPAGAAAPQDVARSTGLGAAGAPAELLERADVDRLTAQLLAWDEAGVLRGERAAATDADVVAAVAAGAAAARTGPAMGLQGWKWHGWKWHAADWQGWKWHGWKWHAADWQGWKWHGWKWHAADWEA